MDIVYILGKGSKCGDLEIKYSLRSLSQHMIDIGNVFVVGEKPEFLEGITHIPAPDTELLAERNAKAKITIACLDDRIGDEFLLMNDDFFALRDFSGAELPHFGRKDGVAGISNPIDFALHVPYRINKKMWLALPWPDKVPNGWSLRTFYFNYYGASATQCPDPIMRSGKFAPSFDEQAKEWDWFSTTDGIFTQPEFLAWLDEHYPKPSRFEI